jgi:hypothetical protein
MDDSLLLHIELTIISKRRIIVRYMPREIAQRIILKYAMRNKIIIIDEYKDPAWINRGVIRR